MKGNFAALPLLFLLLLASVSGCKKEDPNAGDTLTLDQAEYYPAELALVQTGNIPLSEAQYMGSLNGSTLALTNINGSLIFPMPELAPGTYLLKVIIGAKEYTVNCKIKALPAIADPDVIVEDILDSNNSWIPQLFSLADSLDAPARQNCKTDLLALQQFLDSIQTVYATLSVEDRTACARFLRANNGWMQEIHQAAADLIASSATFKTNDAIDDYETRLDGAIIKYTACRIKLSLHIKRIIFLSAAGFGIGSVIPVLGNIAGAKIGAALGIGLLLIDLKATLTAQDDLLNIAFSPYQNLIAEKTAAVVPFTKGNSKPLAVRMNYRSLYAADRNSNVPAVSTFVTDCDLVLSSWNQVKSYVPINLNFNSRIVDDIPTFNTQTRLVHSKYISIGNISNGNVQLLNTDKTDGNLSLTFGNTVTTAQTFTFNLNYQSSRFGSKSSVIEAEVSAGAPPSNLDSNLIGNWRCTAWQLKDFNGIYQDFLNRSITYITSVHEVVCFDTTVYPTKVCVSTYVINDYSLSFSASSSGTPGYYQATYNFSETDVECTTDVNGQWQPCDPVQLPPNNILINHTNAKFSSNLQQKKFNMYNSQGGSLEGGVYEWQGQNQFKLTKTASEYLIFTRQ